MNKKYPNAGAFEQALKARIKRHDREPGVGFNRVLQIVLFERFLARVSVPWATKLCLRVVLQWNSDSRALAPPKISICASRANSTKLWTYCARNRCNKKTII